MSPTVPERQQQRPVEPNMEQPGEIQPPEEVEQPEPAMLPDAVQQPELMEPVTERTAYPDRDKRPTRNYGPPGWRKDFVPFQTCSPPFQVISKHFSAGLLPYVVLLVSGIIVFPHIRNYK